MSDELSKSLEFTIICKFSFLSEICCSQDLRLAQLNTKDEVLNMQTDWKNQFIMLGIEFLIG